MKISEATAKIIRFCAAEEQLNSPEMRKIAEFYANCCIELNTLLAEYARMLKNGLADDALRQADALNPPLAERLKLLSLPCAGEWRKLCRCYDWQVAPELDSATADQLERSRFAQSNSAELVGLWRRGVRTLSARQKILLLRQLLHADPLNAGIWQSNLSEVEAVRFAELSNEISNCHDLPQLKLFCAELEAPELVTRPPAGLLSRAREKRNELQLEVCRCQEQELTEAMQKDMDSSELAVLEKLCRRWRELTQVPNFSPNPNSSALASGIRQKFDALCKRERERTEFDQLSEMLRTALDEGKSYPEIEKLYRAMELLDFSIDPLVSNRVSEHQKAWDEECIRRHQRYLVFGLIGAAVFAFFVLGSLLYHRNSVRERQEQEKCTQQLKAHRYEAVLTRLEQLKKEKPALFRNPVFAALRQDALMQQKEAARIHRQLERQLKQCRPLVSDEKQVEDPALASVLKEAGARLTDWPEPKLQQELESLNSLRNGVLVQLKRRREQWFLKRKNLLSEAIGAISVSEKDSAERLRKTNLQLARCRQQLADWQKEADFNRAFSPDQRTGIVKQLESRIAVRERELQREQKLRTEQQKLQYPADFSGYLAAIRHRSPRFYEAFSGAEKAAELWEGIPSLVCPELVFIDDASCQAKLAELRRLRAGGPTLAMLKQLLPPGVFSGEKLLEGFRKKLSGLTAKSKLYLLPLTTAEGGKTILFYCTGQPAVEQPRGRFAVPSSIAVSLAFQNRKLLFETVWKNHVPYLYLADNVLPGGIRLPNLFRCPPDLAGVQLKVAPHQQELQEAARELAASPNPESAFRRLRETFNELRKDTRIDPRFQRQATIALLLLLPQLTSVSSPVLLIESLTRGQGSAGEALMPKETSATEDGALTEKEFQAIDGFLNQLAARYALFKMVLTTPLHPAGIISKDVTGKPVFHPFRALPAEAGEFYRLVPPATDEFSLELTARRKNGKVVPERAYSPADLGTVLFSPLWPEGGKEIDRLRQECGIALPLLPLVPKEKKP